jgi:hypothetical protein
MTNQTEHHAEAILRAAGIGPLRAFSSDRREAILAAVREAMEPKWLPITDEVKDGRQIIVWSNRYGGRPVIAWWDTDKYAKKPIPRFITLDRSYGARDLFDVAIYQPLPTPPRGE